MKKLTLSGIATAPASARPTHPTVVVEDKDTLALLEQFTIINPKFKELKNQSETLSKQLAPRIKSLYFDRFAGVTPESSTLLVLAGGRTIKLTTKNSYSTMLNDDAPLIAAIGKDLTAQYFRQATVLKLDLEKVPEDKQEDFASQVIALAEKLGVTDAITAKQCIQPRAGFHEARTTILDAEQNRKLDAVLPITAYPQLS